MTRAEQRARKINPNALFVKEDGYLIFIEDTNDQKGRPFRMGVVSTPNGNHALAYCIDNPHSPKPNAGVSYEKGHVRDDGLLCVGENHSTKVDTSPYNIEFCILRARYWAIGFSVLKETGRFPQPDEVAE